MEQMSTDAAALLSRASGWLGAAMDAWARDEQDKVVALAPLAVELATKALLLNANPALLVPLDRQHEASLINLTTEVNLTDTKLRTIGLAEAMKRAGAITTIGLPLSQSRQTRLVACRNGSVHVGVVSRGSGRHVLTDSISVLAWVLHILEQPEDVFFASNLDDCRALMQQDRSEAEQAALALLSRHRRLYRQFMAGLNDEAATAVLTALEEGVLTSHIPMGEEAPDVIASRVACPACKRAAAIYGPVEVDGDADPEWEDGQITYYGRWVVTLTPEMFVCDVCRLRLWGAKDLELVGLPSQPFEPAAADLGDFDPAEYYGVGYGYDDF